MNYSTKRRRIQVYATRDRYIFSGTTWILFDEYMSEDEAREGIKKAFRDHSFLNAELRIVQDFSSFT